MSITVTLAGLDLTPITWIKETRWQKDIIYVYHTIPGSVHGRFYNLGVESAKATIWGRCLKTAANHTLLENMERLSSSYMVVTSSITGTHSAHMTGISDSGSNSAWYYFSISLVADI